MKTIFLKKKSLPGENCQDESRNVSAFDNFKLNVFKILDTIINSIDTRFVPNENLLNDCNWLDPKTFLNVELLTTFPDGALKTVCELAGVNRQVICLELKQFASQFKSFLPNVHHNHNIDFETELLDDESDEEIPKTSNCDKCRNCIYCAFVIIRELSFQSNLFSNLLVVYKFVLTLPSTQVTCERVFSKLKITKT